MAVAVLLNRLMMGATCWMPSSRRRITWRSTIRMSPLVTGASSAAPRRLRPVLSTKWTSPRSASRVGPPGDEHLGGRDHDLVARLQGQVAVQAVAVPERGGIQLDALAGAHDVAVGGARERGRPADGVQGVVDGHAAIEVYSPFTSGWRTIMRLRFAYGVGPPAWFTRSATVAPRSSSYSPGSSIAPAMETVTRSIGTTTRSFIHRGADAAWTGSRAGSKPLGWRSRCWPPARASRPL